MFLLHCFSLEDSCPQRQLCGGNHAATERMIQFGRELQILSEQLCREYGKNTVHKKMLQVSLGLVLLWARSGVVGSFADTWVAPTSAPAEQEGTSVGIRDQNVNLSTRAQELLVLSLASWSNCMLFFSPGDTLPAFPCWLPCQVEGAPSLIHYHDGPLWSLAAKKKRAISFQEVGTCHCGDGRRCPSWTWWFCCVFAALPDLTVPLCSLTGCL